MINLPACCAILLGLAQDAGVPQINCQCQNCLEIKSRCGWPVSLAIVDMQNSDFDNLRTLGEPRGLEVDDRERHVSKLQQPYVGERVTHLPRHLVPHARMRPIGLRFRPISEGGVRAEDTYETGA